MIGAWRGAVDLLLGFGLVLALVRTSGVRAALVALVGEGDQVGWRKYAVTVAGKGGDAILPDQTGWWLLDWDVGAQARKESRPDGSHDLYNLFP